MPLDLAEALENLASAKAGEYWPAHNAARPLLVAHLQALTGCTAEVADIAAGSFLMYGNAPRWGLGDAPTGKGALWAAAETVLEVWAADAATVRKAAA